MLPRFNPIAIAFLLILKVFPLLSQDIRFDKVAIPEEITGTIVGITQDKLGNIWLGSNTSGLYRYDGNEYKSFSTASFNAGSLWSNRVESVYADANGNIWVGTFGNGLDKFDPETGVFTHYKHDKNEPTSISGDTVTCIIEDNNGFIWVGTLLSGLNRLDSKTGKFTHYRHNENDPASLSFDQVRSLYVDKKGVLWVGTGSNVISDYENPQRKGGLNRFNSSTGTFTRYLHEANNPQSLIDNRVRAIYEDSRGTFWVGTAGDGLHTMDRETGTFKRHTYDPLHPDQLSRSPLKNVYNWSDDNITFITEDLKGAIWIGTFQNGVSRYDPISKRTTHYPGQKDGQGNTSGWWGLKSRDGVIWMSVWGGGLFRFDPAHTNIPHVTSFNQREIYAYLEEPGLFQYFGTDSGLVQVDKRTNNARLFLRPSDKQKHFDRTIIFSLYRDKQNRIWAGDFSLPGLCLFDPDKQIFTPYKHDPGEDSALKGESVLSIYEDNQSGFWVGTNRGLEKMNVEKGQFTLYKPHEDDTTKWGKNYVSCIIEDKNQNLWVGALNEGGLHLFDRKSKKFKHYLDRHSVLSLLEDSNGKLWVGAETGGLFYYDKAADNFLPFVDPLTGSSLFTIAIVEDNEKNLWITSISGLIRLNIDRNEITKFGNTFGVNPSRFTGLTSLKAEDGQLFFANGTGYYSVYPDKVIGNFTPPELIITEFRIAGSLEKPADNGALKESLFEAKQVDLSYDQNVFSFQFNVVHFSNPDANKAMYWLENYDKEWRPAGSERTAYYYGVPPGQYTFHIKAVSSEGVWAEKSIAVIIAPPWWRAWWAYLTYGFTFVAVTLSVHKFQRLRVIRSERKRAQEKELEQAREIEKAYKELQATQAQLIQSEKMASLGELTAGIAHEIQNPLNFVNNFSEVNSELIAELKEEVSRGNIGEVNNIANTIDENEKKIIFHGKRADTIVKSMLQHSRSSSNQKESTDINTLADEYLRLAYHGLRAKDKSFNASMKTEFDETIGTINVVPQDIGRVILNLITNAFYVVNEKSKLNIAGYEPTVSIRTKKEGNRVSICVKDNGNGIPESIKEKIFQPFFTTKPAGQGTGLGLSMSYDIVRAHGGELIVETKEGEGSEFITRLPL